MRPFSRFGTASGIKWGPACERKRASVPSLTVPQRNSSARGQLKRRRHSDDGDVSDQDTGVLVGVVEGDVAAGVTDVHVTGGGRDAGAAAALPTAVTGGDGSAPGPVPFHRGNAVSRVGGRRSAPEEIKIVGRRRTSHFRPDMLARAHAPTFDGPDSDGAVASAGGGAGGLGGWDVAPVSRSSSRLGLGGAVAVERRLAAAPPINPWAQPGDDRDEWDATLDAGHVSGVAQTRGRGG